MMTIPVSPKIYHIVHVDRLASIVASNGLLCDSRIVQTTAIGTTIGMGSIKDRRLTELTLDSHPDLYVGACVPCYFCPRSIMLYLIYQANHPELSYRGGQDSIVHLVFDLYKVVDWADANNKRWAFTLSNAGSRYFEDRCDLQHLSEINWNAIKARNWVSVKEAKQAEFLVEESLPWELVEYVGVHTAATCDLTFQAISTGSHKPELGLRHDWYY